MKEGIEEGERGLTNLYMYMVGSDMWGGLTTVLLLLHGDLLYTQAYGWPHGLSHHGTDRVAD